MNAFWFLSELSKLGTKYALYSPYLLFKGLLNFWTHYWNPREETAHPIQKSVFVWGGFLSSTEGELFHKRAALPGVVWNLRTSPAVSLMGAPRDSPVSPQQTAAGEGNTVVFASIPLEIISNLFLFSLTVLALPCSFKGFTSPGRV